MSSRCKKKLMLFYSKKSCILTIFGVVFVLVQVHGELIADFLHIHFIVGFILAVYFGC